VSFISLFVLVTLVRQKVLLPLKNQGESYSFDIAESENDKQIALSPTKSKKERKRFLKVHFK